MQLAQIINILQQPLSTHFIIHYMGLLRFIFLLALLSGCTSIICHYSCVPGSCTSTEFYTCTACASQRGNGGKPIYGMCYCSSDADQDEKGVCQTSGSFNNGSKNLIIAFIALAIVFAVAAIFVKGMKYFLYKTIEDVQELSLIVFINLYFPQQFDIFLTKLYRFNISSYTFENLALGSLFQVMPDASIASTDGQNIFGKYRLLIKTANFFSNQFTWMIVFFSIFVFAVLVRWLRNWLKKKQDYQTIRTQIEGKPPGMQGHDGSHQVLSQSMAEIHEYVEVKKVNKDEGKYNLYFFVNKLYNILWFNFLIVFFYFSIIEMNINIFTQIANLTFSSPFATAGAFFSALFFSLQITLLVMLFLKAKEEMIKPEWMRDYSFTPTIYLVRTNFKTITKYFWFFTCLKKMMLSLMVTVLYDNPLAAIVGVSSVHAVYISLAIYCEPFDRKYIRIHFYLTQAMKMFMFLSLVNFTTKYAEFVQLINLTIIFYALLAFIFGMHLFFLLVSICVEKDVYCHFLRKKFCAKDHPELEHSKIGYRSNQKVFIYVKE